MTLDDKFEKVKELLREMGTVVVAFSGGVDSALVAWMANEVLGPKRCQVVTASSASLARRELDDCRSLADEWGLSWQLVETSELADPDYVRNDVDRCARCKDALMDVLEPIAAAAASVGSPDSPAVVLLGVNVDDLGDHRPGQGVAAARGARFPLVDAGFTKAMVRAGARRLGLRTWNKPAAACLASRIPDGTEVSAEVLDQVGRAEAGLVGLGFDDVRVRHYDELARVEVPLDRLDELVRRRTEVVEVVRRAGYEHVTVDLEGLRSGNLNHASGITTNT
jgi:pyridinium-3,5-biscarboxylic acid mononucleotide sulfurtransferase